MGESIAAKLERMREGKTTKSQKKLLAFFESVDYKQIIYFSITQLAETTGVAEATVLRFCRMLGFNGYQEFKLYLAQDMVAANFKETSETELVSKIAEEFESAIIGCCKALTNETLAEAVDYLKTARTVSCFGVGNSYLPALELHNRLTKMGLLSSCERDPHCQNVLTAMRGAGDLMVLFSISGGTKDVIEVAELARANGLKIIVITGYEQSPLARFADLMIITPPKETPVETGLPSSRIMQLFVVDVLCSGLYQTDKAGFDSCIAKGNRATAGKLI